jgi:translation initiation factor 3 subunit A
MERSRGKLPKSFVRPRPRGPLPPERLAKRSGFVKKPKNGNAASERRKKRSMNQVCFCPFFGITPDNDLALIARLAEEERLRLEREAEEAAEEAKRKETEAAEEAKRKEEEEGRAALIEQRRKEREELDKKAALQRQREEEAERRRAERSAAAKSQPQSSTPIPWRKSTPQGTTPSTPPRSESPAPAAGKYRPGAFNAVRTQQQQAQPPERTSSPAPTKTEDTWQRRGPLKSEEPTPKWRARAVEERKADEESPNPPTSQADPDGFQTVEKKNVWRPSRGRGGPRP